MSFRLSNLGLGILLAVLGASGASVNPALAQGTASSTRELSASETNSADVFRTMNQWGAKDDGLRRLQEELNKTSLSLSRHSLENDSSASYAPLQIPTVPARRKKNALSNFDSLLSNPDSSTSGKSTEDYLGFPELGADAKEKTKAGWEQIYQRLKRDDASAAGLGSSVKAGARQPMDAAEDDRDLPSGIRENTDKLKSNLAGSDFGASIFKPSSARSSFSDFFGIGATPPTPEQTKARKEYMDNFVTTVFGDQSPAAAMNSLQTAGNPSATLKARVSSPLDTLSTSSPRSDSFKPSSSISATLLPTTLPDLNANALNQWNPMYTEPKLELPKSQPLFTPPVEAPRRRFF